MFTGLVEDVGTIARVEKRINGALLTITHSKVIDDLARGDSIAVDGVCLTVTELGSGWFGVEVSAEPLRRSTLHFSKVKRKVNLERALRVGDRLGGHLVTGHVDGVGNITDVIQEGKSRRLTIAVGSTLNRYLVEKGSVAVDGISLTVNETAGDRFGVTIIPYTGSHTVVTTKQAGDEVNIEADIIGKYVDHLLSRESGRQLDVDFLSEHGFL